MTAPKKKTHASWTPPPLPTPITSLDTRSDSNTSTAPPKPPGGNNFKVAPSAEHLSVQQSSSYRRRPATAPVPPLTLQKRPACNPYRQAALISANTLTRDAQLNVESDGLAPATTKVVIAHRGHPKVAPTLSLLFEGSEALVGPRKTWISSKYKSVLVHAHRETTFHAYRKGKYGWDEDDFNLVYLSPVGRVQRLFHPEVFRQNPYPDEALGHILWCPLHLMAKKRK